MSLAATGPSMTLVGSICRLPVGLFTCYCANVAILTRSGHPEISCARGRSQWCLDAQAQPRADFLGWYTAVPGARAPRLLALASHSFRQLPTRPVSLLERTGQSSLITPLPVPDTRPGGFRTGEAPAAPVYSGELVGRRPCFRFAVLAWR